MVELKDDFYLVVQLKKNLSPVQLAVSYENNNKNNSYSNGSK